MGCDGRVVGSIDVGSITAGAVDGVINELGGGACDCGKDGSGDGCSDGFGVGFPMAASLLMQ